MDINGRAINLVQTLQNETKIKRAQGIAYDALRNAALDGWNRAFDYLRASDPNIRREAAKRWPITPKWIRLTDPQRKFLLYLKTREDLDMVGNYPNPRGGCGNAQTGLSLAAMGFVRTTLPQISGISCSYKFTLTRAGEELTERIKEEATHGE